MLKFINLGFENNILDANSSGNRMVFGSKLEFSKFISNVPHL